MAAESWTPRDLVLAGWTDADLEWESATEAAFAALAAGDREAARAHVSSALRAARGHFTDIDPRLGTSLANQAGGLAESGDGALAMQLLHEAIGAWRSCDPWVARLRAPRTARSSLFHMRLERRHRGAYEERWRRTWNEYVEGARIRLERLGTPALVGLEDAAAHLARWRRERPATLDDTRKLMAAAMLIACRSD